MALVGVVIPTLNRVWGLRSALESALAQTHPECANYEVHPVDGGVVRFGGHSHETNTEVQRLDLVQAALSHEWFVGTTRYGAEAVREVWPSLGDDDLVLDLGLNLRLAFVGGSAVAITQTDFELGEHSGQNSNARQSEVFEQTDRLLRALLADGLPKPYERLARRALASWRTVWGLELARHGLLSEARARFAEAVRASRRSGWPWWQLLISLVRPGSLLHTDREEVQLR
jgi:hypothetical protein